MDNLLPAVKLPVQIIAFDYARLSRDRKRLSENVGIQHRENQYFIEDQGWELGGSREDNDISASEFGTKIREGYDQLIQDIKNVPDRDDVIVKVFIVVTEMPRLYRQVEELLPLIKMAERTRLSGIWTTDGEGYDLSTPEGIHRAIGAVNNAMLESKRASKRQRRKKRAQAAKGQYMGAARRYGYEGAIKDEHGNITNRARINIAEVPEEIAHWKDWFNRLVAGEAQMSIVRDNNQRGIPAPEGGKWTVGNFKRMVTNESFVIFDAAGHQPDCPCLLNAEGNGTLFHKPSGARHRGRWKGLITRQEHEVLLSCFRAKAQDWDHGLVKGRQYLLSGIAICGGTYEGEPCPAKMYGNGRTLASGNYQRRYRCKSHDNHGEQVGCGKVYRDAAALDEFVTSHVLYRINTAGVARALAPQEDGDRADELTNKLAAQLKRRDLIRRQYARGEIGSLEDYKFMRSEADDAVDELRAELGTLRTGKAMTLLPADGQIQDAWYARFAAGDLAWCRSVIQLVVKKVVVKPGIPGGTIWNGRRFNPEDVEIIWLH